MSEDGAAAGEAPSGGRRRAGTLYGAIGTLIEFYDYSIYAYLAPYLAVAFFGDASAGTGLLLTYGLFALSSAARILGGGVLGAIGDRVGRKRALTLALGLMTAAMVVTSVLPTYAQVGILSPALFVVLRLLQGFSAGGEYSGALVFLIEDAPRRSRGLTATLGIVTSGTGALLASGVALLLTAVTDDAQMDSWGWRVGYWVGAALALGALALRLRMEESPAFERARARRSAERGSPLRRAVRDAPGRMLIAATLVGFGGLTYYLVLTFIPTYLETIIDVEHAEALLVTTVMVAIWAYASPLAGHLSDVVGRRPLLLGAAAAYALVGYPAFRMIATGELWLIAIAELALVVPLIMFQGAVSAAVGELFGTSSRYSSLAVSYNAGNAIVGGTAPFVATLLVALTGNDLAPGWYLAAAAVLTIPAVLAMAETARRPLREDPVRAG